MKKFYKDLFFSVIAIIFFFLTTNAYAVEDEVGADLQKVCKSSVAVSNIGVGVEEDGYNSNRSQAVSTCSTAVNMLLFIDPTVSYTYAEIIKSPNVTPDMKGGIFGLAKDSVYAMYKNQPYIGVYAHLVEEWVPGYQKDTSVYAYESGYQELLDSGISDVWSVARNISYIFFIVIMIVIGFMIMFRSKLGGQTLVTLGNTLPNVILALIGVTFSFAIAGLIIDFGGVIMTVLVDIFDNLGTEGSVSLNFTALFGALIPKALISELGIAVENLKDAAGESLLKAFAIGGLGNLVGMLIAQSTGLISVIIGIVILGVGTVGIVKVFITLVKAYLSILVNVITGPFQIAMSALPGKNVLFINWMKNILRSVIVYPIVFAVINLPDVVYASAKDGSFKLPGPDKLVVPQGPGTSINTGGDGIFNFGGILTGFIVFAVQILVIFAASKADSYARAIIPPSTSREGGAAAQDARAALSGIPLVGSLLGKS